MGLMHLFHLSACLSPKEEHLCACETSNTRIQLTLMVFPTSCPSAQVQMPSGSRANTDTTLMQLNSFPPAAEDSQGAAVAAIEV